MNPVRPLKGKKTYLVALAGLAVALVQYLTGQDPQVDWQLIIESLGLATLRAGVAKAAKAAGVGVIVSALCLFGGAASAADSKLWSLERPNFAAGEVVTSVFGVMSRPDITGDANWGAGAGVSYFVTRGLGFGVYGVSYEDFSGSAIDEIRPAVELRAPLWNRLALTGTFFGIHSFESNEWGAGAYGGAELRLTRNIGVFGKTGLDVMVDGSSAWATWFGLNIALPTR